MNNIVIETIRMFFPERADELEDIAAAIEAASAAGQEKVKFVGTGGHDIEMTVGAAKIYLKSREDFLLRATAKLSS